MMDLATLALKLDSSEVKTGVSELDKLTAAGTKAEKSVDGVGHASERAGKSTRTAAESAAIMAARYAAIGAAFTYVTKQALDFQNAMAEVSTLVDTAVVNMEELNQTALDQARAFGAAPTDQAKALYQIISAGASTAAEANDILTASNKLAVGGVTDVATAADGLTSVMNAYGDAAGSANDVSDAMFVAMKAGKTTIGELSSSLGAVAPLAAQLGVSFDELVGATAALTKGGIGTSEAMTGLRAVMAAVAKPSEEAAKLAKQLGIDFSAAGLQAQGFAGFMEELKTKTGGSQEALAKLFGGVEALVPVLALTGQAGEDFNAILVDLEHKVGAAEEAFTKMSESSGFQVDKLLANIKVEAIEAGTAFLQLLVPALQAINENFGTITTVIKSAIGGFVAYKATLLLTTAATTLYSSAAAVQVAAALSVTRQIGLLAAAKATLSGVTAGATVLMRGFTAALITNPFTAVAVAIGVVAGAMIAFSNETRNAREETRGLIADLKNLAAQRGAEYESRKIQLEMRRNELATSITQLEVDKQSRAANPFLAQRDGADRYSKKLQALKWDLVEVEGGLRAADIAARKAAESQDVATVSAQGLGTATDNAASSTAKAAKATNDYAQFLADLNKEIAGIGKTTEEMKELEIVAKAAAAAGAGFDKMADEIIKAGKAYKQLKAEQNTKDFIKDLEKQTAEYGKTSLELLNMAVAAEVAKAATADLAKAAQNAGAALTDKMIAKATKDHADYVAQINAENTLLGMTGSAREQAALMLEKQAFFASAAALGIKDVAAEWQKLEDARQVGIDFTAGNEQAQDFLDNLNSIADSASDIGAIFADAFGGIGNVIGGAVARLTDYAAVQEEIRQSGKSTEVQERELATLRTRTTAGFLKDMKGVFKEHSAGYKAMEAAEKIYAALQFANMVKSLVMDATKTASTLANNTVQTTSNVATGASKIFAELGPWGFPVVAAMIGVMAALGFGGGGGGSGSVPPPSAADRQAGIGTGTVLGDSGAQSQSLVNALETIADNTNDDLEYSNDMVKYLREISAGIGNLTGQISRQIGLGASGNFDTSGLGLGSSGKPGFLGLFGSSKTSTLYDQGLEIFQQSVGDILAGNFQAQVYNVVETVKKKSGFLGIGGSTKTTYSTTTGSVDDAITKQFSLIVDDVISGVKAFAEELQITVGGGIDEYFNSLQLPQMKLSFKDMTGEEIQAALEAYISSVADMLVGVLDGPLGLSDLQRAGEGLFETLARVTRTIMTVNTSLSSIGMDAMPINGAAAIGRVDSLAGQFGGLSEMQEAVASFADKFLSEAEQMQPIMDAVAGEMERLGQSGVTTNEQFKALVLGLDLSTDAGQELFAQLLSVAPAFAKVNEYLAEVAETSGEAGKTLQELAAIQKEQRSLEIQLMEATGNAEAALAAKRADALAATDESNRALQQSVFDAQDATQAQRDYATAMDAAAKIAENIAKTRHELELQLMEATGQGAKALNMRRVDELNTMDESLRMLQRTVWAEQDAIAIREDVARRVKEAAEAQAAAEQLAIDKMKELAQTRRELDIRLMEATGDAAGVLAATRADELAVMDESLRGLLSQIFAAEDLAEATRAATAAQEEAAQEAARIAEQAAADMARIADERAGLERQLLELMGDTNAIRALELAVLDPSNRSLLERIYAIEDERAAAELAAQAADDLAQANQAIADELSGLQRQLLEAQGNVAALRELDLAAMLSDDARAVQQQIWAIEEARIAQEALATAQADAARIADDAAKELERIATERFGIEGRILQLMGDTAAIRERELAALDPSNRALQDQVYALEDAAVAAKELADAQAESTRAAEQAAQEVARLAQEESQRLAGIANERAGLERQILELLGDTVALRTLELDALDPSNRVLQERIYQLQDEAVAATAAQAAAEDAARAAQALIDEQQRLADDAAQEAKRIADERYGLETRLLELQGKTLELRERELALISPVNRAMQEQIWAMEDAAAAATAAADAQSELARQQEEAAQAAETLRKAGVDLQIRYFETLGNTAAATALRRQEELAATDDSNKALLMQIYALEDAKIAEEAYTDALVAKNAAVEQARNNLSAAYEREAGALQDTINRFQSFGDALRDFRAGLFLSEAGASASYRQLQVDFIKTSALAATGDQGGLAGLQGAGSSFLEASRAQASSLVQYQRDVAMVARSVDTAIGAADEAVDYAQLQLTALDNLVGGYIDLNENVVSVSEAIQQLREAQAKVVVPATVEPIVDAQETQTKEIKDSNARLEQRVMELEQTLSLVLVSINDKLNSIDSRERKYDRGDYKAIGNDTDTPITVGNTSASPLFTDEVV